MLSFLHVVSASRMGLSMSDDMRAFAVCCSGCHLDHGVMVCHASLESETMDLPGSHSILAIECVLNGEPSLQEQVLCVQPQYAMVACHRPS